MLGVEAFYDSDTLWAIIRLERKSLEFDIIELMAEILKKHCGI